MSSKGKREKEEARGAFSRGEEEEERTMPKTGKKVRELSRLMELGRLAGVEQKLSEGRD